MIAPNVLTINVWLVHRTLIVIILITIEIYARVGYVINVNLIMNVQALQVP